ncbi:MAG: aldo/keto reductase [Devosia sp.]|nr:aldo/keto reductase [Devosia sp.]
MPGAATELPVIGLGTGPLKGDGGVSLMIEALRMGYRLLDTAAHYGNEAEVGEAIRASGVPRHEIIVLTKIWPDRIDGKTLPQDAEAGLRRLGLDHIDILVPHWPNPTIPLAETIGALNDLRRVGITREIGLSNFTIGMMREAQSLSEAPIVVNEVEYHPYLVQQSLAAACRDAGIAMVTHCPLGRAGALFAEPAVTKVADRLGKTPAQIVLRWQVQQGAIPIPSSHSASRLRQNIAIFDFTLNEPEMAAISALSAHRHRICEPPIPYSWDTEVAPRLNVG